MNKTKQQLQSGTLLQNGKYKIIRILGQGGFGITYEVEQTMLKAHYAIKEFFVNTKDVYCRRDISQNNKVTPHFDTEMYEKLREGFIKEARTLYQLDNISNIVKVRDTFEENETVYIVMDFVQGMPLGEMIEKKGVLPEEKVKKYSVQILRALQQIHQQNILHRDIKPDNILINSNDTAVLIDFGIARNFVDDKTQFHTAMLSPGYAPPEQEVAYARKGAYSDLYSMGATMYYCLTGKKPQTLSELNFEDYVSAQSLNPNISNELNTIINKAIEKKPKDRFKSCKEFISCLNNNEGTVIRYQEAFLLTNNKTPDYIIETVNGVSFKMIKIEGGSFNMGSNDGYDNEKPIHRVNVPTFYMAETLVTQSLWKAVMGNNPSYFKKTVKWFKREGNYNHPVESISWNDIQNFIQQLNQLIGKDYRLPTEAEWEYAVKGGTTTPFYTGDNITTNQANYDGNYPYKNNAKGEYRKKTTQVKSFPPNSYGLYDMSGNVKEWCEDKWHSNYKGAPTDGSAWLVGNSSFRVLRGGSWYNYAENCRSVDRSYYSPGGSNNGYGFRLALDN